MKILPYLVVLFTVLNVVACSSTTEECQKLIPILRANERVASGIKTAGIEAKQRARLAEISKFMSNTLNGVSALTISDESLSELNSHYSVLVIQTREQLIKMHKVLDEAVQLSEDIAHSTKQLSSAAQELNQTCSTSDNKDDSGRDWKKKQHHCKKLSQELATTDLNTLETKKLSNLLVELKQQKEFTRSIQIATTKLVTLVKLRKALIEQDRLIKQSAVSILLILEALEEKRKNRLTKLINYCKG